MRISAWSVDVCSSDLRLHFYPANEGKNVGVNDLGMGRAQAVRQVLVGLERAVLQELDRQRRRIRIGHDLVVFAVDDQHRYVDRLQILGEVGFGEGLDALVTEIGSASCRERVCTYV